MSIRHKKHSTKQPLASKELPARKSRHGRVMVGPSSASSDDQRGSPFIHRERKIITNPKTGAVEVRHIEYFMTQEQVQAERAKVMRARASTTSYGIKAPRTNEEHKQYLRGK